MAQQQDLFDMTFDQQLHVTKGRIEGRDISPNRCIPGENLTQPLSRGMEQIILPTALVPQVGLVRSANMGRPETGNKLL